MRGRPPTATRQRLLTYIKRARPKTVMQMERATGIKRREIYRMLIASFGKDWRSRLNMPRIGTHSPLQRDDDGEATCASPDLENSVPRA